MSGILSRISRKQRKKAEPVAELHRTLNPSTTGTITTVGMSSPSYDSDEPRTSSGISTASTLQSSQNLALLNAHESMASACEPTSHSAGAAGPGAAGPILSSSEPTIYSAGAGATAGATASQPTEGQSSSANSNNQSDVTPDLMNISVTALGFKTRQVLSWHLNPTKPLGSDWRGLADYMDFTQLDIDNFALRENPTAEVLRQWQSRPDSTIGKLLGFLHDLEREDAVSALEKPISIDVKRWMKENADLDGKPLQVDEVSGSYPNQPMCPSHRGITLNDHPDGPPQLFDAYICHNAKTDYPFVMEILNVMEKPPFNLKLCTDWRDLVPGGSYISDTAELIENRCKRMIVVLSPEFLESENCDFHMKFALSLNPGARSRRMVLVMLHQCEPPNILRFITVCDYTREALRPYFWPRLYAALNLS